MTTIIVIFYFLTGAIKFCYDFGTGRFLHFYTCIFFMGKKKLTLIKTGVTLATQGTLIKTNHFYLIIQCRRRNTSLIKELFYNTHPLFIV